MKIKLLVPLLLLVLASSAFADTFRVHYSIMGAGAMSRFKRNHPPRLARQSWRCFPAL
jgi:hypothetical protein